MYLCRWLDHEHIERESHALSDLVAAQWFAIDEFQNSHVDIVQIHYVEDGDDIWLGRMFRYIYGDLGCEAESYRWQPSGRQFLKSTKIWSTIE